MRLVAVTLQRLSWAVLLCGGGIILVVGAEHVGASMHGALTATMAAFFLLLLGRLLLSGLLQPARRMPLLCLAAGLASWAAGSVALIGGGVATLTRFPAPGELWFLASYVGIVSFLLLDVPRRTSRGASVWLETAVVCGGVACIAASVLLMPAAQALGASGMPLFMALLYPLIDSALALTVLGQVLLRQRRVSWQTTTLSLGFLAVAVADCSLVANLASDTYVSSASLDLVYGLGFALVVAGATTSSVDSAAPNRRQPASLLVAAASVAVGVLVTRPAGFAGWYVTVPAVITLTAAMWRLTLAMRDAERTSEELRLAKLDELTSLPNRRGLLIELEASIRLGGPIGVLLLDIDGFKDINDSLGHESGDAVLQVVARRLTKTLGSSATVARQGADEFAVVVRLDDDIVLLETARRARDELLRPVLVNGMELAIRTSVGVAAGAGTDLAPSDVLRRAEVALNQARSARSAVVLYDATRDEFSHHRLALIEELRRGIENDQLVLWYQPQVDAVTDEVLGVEALVRWEHPQHGLLQPAAFLPDARRSGLMRALSEQVMRLAVTDARGWLDRGLDFHVAVNCAPPELLAGSVLPQLFRQITEHGLPPQSILVEVTEDSFIADPERARETLLDLRAHQVQISVDDYGTGFSSLAYLRDLPVQELKIDRTFVATMRSDPRSKVIVDSTRQMAHAMGLRLVAEGVEDADTGSELASMGVDVLQGYHIARPMPARDVEAWVRRRTAAAPTTGAPSVAGALAARGRLLDESAC